MKKANCNTNKTTSKIGQVFATFFIGLLFCASKAIYQASNTWNNLTIDEIIFHLKAPKEGADQELVLGFILGCLAAAAAAVIIHLILIRVFQKRKHKKTLINIIGISLGSLSLILSIIYVWDKWNLSEYIKSQTTYSNFIDDNYIDPSTVTITFPEEKRNLIYIYLESVETTYADKSFGGAFDNNYIPRLTELALENESFNGNSNTLNGGFAMNNTTWTMGAMFGQSTGLPLTLPIDNNTMDTQNSFFPNITAIGDILESEGYNNSLMIGSKAVFGGRELFYRDHGNYTFYDYTYSLKNGEIPEDYFVFWGYEDERLFENSKKHLLEVNQNNQPFNFTILTVDTHFEDGYLCSDCPATYGDNQYANVISCSDQKVYDFIHWIQEQDFYENTTIILTGDHPTMDIDFCESVDDDYVRKVYTTIINAPVEPQLEYYREYSTFDLFPTTIAALGATIEGERLGLGTNLYSYKPTLSEEYGRDIVNAEIMKKSSLMEDLASQIENTNRYSEGLRQVLGIKTKAHSYNETENTFKLELFGDVSSCSTIFYNIYTKEDKSDSIQYTATLTEDGSYISTVNCNDFKSSSIYYADIHGIHAEYGTEILLISSEINLQKLMENN